MSDSVAAISQTPNHACHVCSAPFHAKRADACYCSASCRKRASREADEPIRTPANDNEVPEDFRRWLVRRAYAGRITHNAVIYGLTVPLPFAVAEWNAAHPDKPFSEAVLKARLREAGWLTYEQQSR